MGAECTKCCSAANGPHLYRGGWETLPLAESEEGPIERSALLGRREDHNKLLPSLVQKDPSPGPVPNREHFSRSDDGNDGFREAGEGGPVADVQEDRQTLNDDDFPVLHHLEVLPLGQSVAPAGLRDNVHQVVLFEGNLVVGRVETLSRSKFSAKPRLKDFASHASCSQQSTDLDSNEEENSLTDGVADEEDSKFGSVVSLPPEHIAKNADGRADDKRLLDKGTQSPVRGRRRKGLAGTSGPATTPSPAISEHVWNMRREPEDRGMTDGSPVEARPRLLPTSHEEREGLAGSKGRTLESSQFQSSSREAPQSDEIAGFSAAWAKKSGPASRVEKGRGKNGRGDEQDWQPQPDFVPPVEPRSEYTAFESEDDATPAAKAAAEGKAREKGVSGSSVSRKSSMSPRSSGTQVSMRRLNLPENIDLNEIIRCRKAGYYLQYLEKERLLGFVWSARYPAPARGTKDPNLFFAQTLPESISPVSQSLQNMQKTGLRVLMKDASPELPDSLRDVIRPNPQFYQACLTFVDFANAKQCELFMCPGLMTSQTLKLCLLRISGEVEPFCPNRWYSLPLCAAAAFADLQGLPQRDEAAATEEEEARRQLYGGRHSLSHFLKVIAKLKGFARPLNFALAATEPNNTAPNSYASKILSVYESDESI